MVTEHEPWRGPLLRLPGGTVLLAGSALLDVVRALETAQQVTRRDGFAPNSRWLALLAELRLAAAEALATAPRGSAAVPQIAQTALLSQDLIGTSEVAAMLGCNPRNVRDLRAREVLRSGRIVGGRLLFERSEVVAEARRREESARQPRGSAVA